MQRMAEVTMRVVNEDMAVVQNLNPIRTPDSNTKEVLVPGDTAIAAYREWLKKWDAKGWKIDVKALNARLGDYAVTIPCPARRTSDNWVHGDRAAGARVGLSSSGRSASELRVEEVPDHVVGDGGFARPGNA